MPDVKLLTGNTNLHLKLKGAAHKISFTHSHTIFTEFIQTIGRMALSLNEALSNTIISTEETHLHLSL